MVLIVSFNFLFLFIHSLSNLEIILFYLFAV